MAKRPKMPRDPNQLAAKILKIATGEEAKPDIHTLPKGSAGGMARAKSLTQIERKELAKKAARSRWGSPNSPEEHPS